MVVRLEDGTTERRQVEVVATVGASTVVRGDLPEGIEVEVPGTAATTATAAQGAAAANGLPLGGIPGVTPRGEFPGGGAGGFGGARGGQ